MQHQTRSAQASYTQGSDGSSVEGQRVARVQDRFGNRSVAGAVAGEWSGQEPLIAAEVALQAAGVPVALVDGSNAGLLQSWRHGACDPGEVDPAMQAFTDRAHALGAGAFLGSDAPQGAQCPTV